MIMLQQITAHAPNIICLGHGQLFGVCNEINVIGDWPSNGESYYLLDIKNTTPKMQNNLFILYNF